MQEEPYYWGRNSGKSPLSNSPHSSFPLTDMETRVSAPTDTHFRVPHASTSHSFSSPNGENHDAALFTGTQPEEIDEEQILPLRALLRQTGLGIKIRFLLALTLVAVFPAICLVLLLGDPSGQEQRTALGQAISMQAQAQGNALNAAIALRQQEMAALAKTPALLQGTQPVALQGGAVPGIVGQGTVGQGTSLPPGAISLETAQQADAASIVWMLVQPNGKIVLSGNTPDRLQGTMLARTNVVSTPALLNQMVSQTASGSENTQPLLENDTRIHGGWLALASRIRRGNGDILLAVFSLQKIVGGQLSVPNSLGSEAEAILDRQGRLVAYSGAVAQGQKLFTQESFSIQGLPQTTGSGDLINDNPLTGRKDLAAVVALPSLGGRYLLFVPQDTSLAPSTRVYFAGRNTPLLILGILVVVVLVATWVALPIVRPIRRATREIGHTTSDVRELAEDARRIAQDHAVGTTILSGASRRLGTRRQSIIRDGTTIAQLCQALQPRMQWLSQVAQSSQHQQALDVIRVVQQGLAQIYQLGTTIAGGLENDATLNQLDAAMKSAQEISTQFESAGKQLERGAQQLEEAAQTLL